MQETQRVLVVGATGGSGRAAVEELLQEGHRVTAFSRHADQLEGLSGRLTTVNGDATLFDDLDRVVPGHDAVVVTLGIAENPIRVRLFGASSTPDRVRSVGTRNVIAAMRKHGVRRLVVQSSYGVGETRHRLRIQDRAFFELLLKPQISDTELQEREVRHSDRDWVLAQPVHLTDAETEDPPFTSIEGEVRSWQVSRRSVGSFLAAAVRGEEFVGHSVAVSGAA